MFVNKVCLLLQMQLKGSQKKKAAESLVCEREQELCRTRESVMNSPSWVSLAALIGYTFANTLLDVF